MDYSESCGCRDCVADNPNEYIMKWYGRADEMRAKKDSYFMMMTQLTDVEYVTEMMGKLKNYRHLFRAENFRMLVNRKFIKNTDIQMPAGFTSNSYLELVKFENGNSIVEKRVVRRENVYYEMLEDNSNIFVFPLHWQDEFYGYMAIAVDVEDADFDEYYEFMMSIEQVMGTVRKQAQLQDMYVKDALTMLYNRFGFYSCFERDIKKYKRKRKWMFMVSIDMDGLKYINDTFGHAEGDVAIKAMASILMQCKGENGVVARFGGDEYVLYEMFDSDADKDNIISEFERKFNEEIDSYNSVSGKSYKIGASCGILYREIKGVGELDDIMKEADDAMYKCKEEHHAGRRSGR